MRVPYDILCLVQLEGNSVKNLLPGLIILWLGVGLAQASLEDTIARIHYQRPDSNYEGFELHV